jgi:CheY-like chemotaxis protein
MNLLLNARDALEAAGQQRPHIRVEVSSATELRGPSGQTLPGPFGRLTVRDNAGGIPVDVIEHVFEPFFTTKGARGTGLGLATSYAIARRTGGWMSVSSAVGEGSTFELVLPCSAGTAAPPPELEVARPRTTTVPEARILLVDDEPLVRRVAVRSLKRHGFDVVAVASVREAEEHLIHDRDFDLAIVDRSMPEAPGRTLVGHLRRVLPDARIAFLTGDLVAADEAALVDGVLSKPMTSADLASAVHDLLRGA